MARFNMEPQCPGLRLAPDRQGIIGEAETHSPRQDFLKLSAGPCAHTTQEDTPMPNKPEPAFAVEEVTHGCDEVGHPSTLRFGR